MHAEFVLRARKNRWAVHDGSLDRYREICVLLQIQERSIPAEAAGSLLMRGLVHATDPAEGLRQRLSRRCAYGPAAIRSISM